MYKKNQSLLLNTYTEKIYTLKRTYIRTTQATKKDQHSHDLKLEFGLTQQWV